MENLRDGRNSYFNFHWRAPIVMILSLLVGTALALGHHAFYASLAGSSVSSDPIKVIGWTTTQQQVNIAVGTAFAFLVKASLILACSTAYMQLLFGTINRRNFKLSTLDNWFGGLNDFWSLGCLSTYWRYPLLTLVALTCWLLPIAAIISPASLSVVVDQVHPSPIRSALVPQPALDSMALGIYTVESNSGTQEILYKGANNEVTRIAYAAAAAGSILSIEPPAANSSWELELTASRYSCASTEPDVVNMIKDNLIDVLNNATYNGTWKDLSTIMFTYLSWTALSNSSSPTPFKQLTVQAGWTLQETGGYYFKEVGVDLFVGILPRAYDILTTMYEPDFPLNPRNASEGNQASADEKITLMNWYFETATTIRCKAVPTTYRIGFSYSGTQDQHIKILSASDAVDFHTIDPRLYAKITSDGNLAVLRAIEEEGGAQNITSAASTIFRLGSYAAIQSATNQLITGAANNYASQAQGIAYIPISKKPSWQWNTRIFATTLAGTEEMQALTNEGLPTAYNITQNESGVAFDEAKSLLMNSRNQAVRPLKAALEELLFNVTLSMAGSPMLTYNATSPLAPPPTDVTLSVFGNVYSYGSDKLWLAYGIAIGVTLLNVVVGLFAIVRTGASFTNNFSTTVRVAKNAVIEADMRERSLPGKDPLPSHLARTEMQLRQGVGLLEPKSHDSTETVHYIVGYAPPRLDSVGWK